MKLFRNESFFEVRRLPDLMTGTDRPNPRSDRTRPWGVRREYIREEDRIWASLYLIPRRRKRS